ncbi:MarR family winged helix-turn-helix transcriptional regulator [Fervidobacterium thailandense]|uniref:MarR family transcriptional regulator n=1 Tax=Fervidobacterium thailandense TaxID=1008305 RepID=A0A1E3G332_9BACT|nr:MarR family transcriptional regulator [Fervidobacterium thailandense]ODN30706.1 MarR family transcriptional regulator [Fervidobacterium thailandense]
MHDGINDRFFEELERMLRLICFRIRVTGREALKNYPITPAQFDLLQRLYFDGPQTMTKLSQVLGVAKSTTTGLVTRLERDGFLRRRPSDEDKRVIVVEITELGREVIRSVINKRVEYVRKVVSDLGNLEAVELFEKLKRLYEVIQEQ